MSIQKAKRYAKKKGIIKGNTPSICAYRLGFNDSLIKLETWTQDVPPPDIKAEDVPFNSKTQDALVRAYVSGWCMAQSLFIESLVTYLLKNESTLKV